VTRSQWPAASERCAVRADLRGDPMLGTAFPAARLLLVEQPFPWGPEGLRTSRFERDTALAVEARAREEGVRVQAIRRPGRAHEGTRRRWMFVDTRDAARSVRCGEFSEEADLLELPFDGSRGRLDPSPLYLVCSHGRHDPCCGERGRPMVATLSASRPEQVWQASHLGGCRFAPTVLVLPLGVMYGRVPPSATADVVAAAEAGEVLGEHFRGRIGTPPAAQAAIGFAHERLAMPRVQDVSLVSTTAIDGATVVVRIDSPQGPFDITVERTRIDATGLTCGAPGPSWFVAHRPLTIEPASGS
jgi:(2Fe-2S) ferredoxin